MLAGAMDQREFVMVGTHIAKEGLKRALVLTPVGGPIGIAIRASLSEALERTLGDTKRGYQETLLDIMSELIGELGGEAGFIGGKAFETLDEELRQKLEAFIERAGDISYSGILNEYETRTGHLKGGGWAINRKAYKSNNTVYCSYNFNLAFLYYDMPRDPSGNIKYAGTLDATWVYVSGEQDKELIPPLEVDFAIKAVE